MTEAQGSSVPGSEANHINRAFAGVGATLGLFVWLNLFSIPFGVASIIIGKSHPRLGVAFGFLAMLTVVPGVLWVARSAWGSGWRRALPLAAVSPGLLVWTIFGVLALIPVVMAWVWTIDRTMGLPHFPDPFPRVGVLGVVLGAPIAEELLFRGYGLARIRELAGEKRALLYTALMFALVHGSWVKFPGTFAIGLFLGWLVLRTGSLWPALLGHLTNNASAYVMTGWNPPSSFDPVNGSWATILILGAAGLASLAILWSPRMRGRIRGLNASA